MRGGRAARSGYGSGGAVVLRVRWSVLCGTAPDTVRGGPARYFASFRPRSSMPDSAFSWPASTPAVKPDLAVASWTAV